MHKKNINSKAILVVAFFVSVLSSLLEAQSSAPSESLPPSDSSPPSELSSDSVDEAPVPLMTHRFGIGLSGYIFLNDLAELNHDTYGYSGSYEYIFPMYKEIRPSLGLRFEYFVAKDGDLRNEHILVMPYVKIPLFAPEAPSALALLVGMDNDFWKQSITVARTYVLHKDLLFGLVIGLHESLYKSFWGEIEIGVDYHMQEVKFKTSFMAIGLQYIWSF